MGGLGGPGGSLGGPSEVLGDSWGPLVGPCGVLGPPIRGNVEKSNVFQTFPRGLGALWSLLGGFLVSLGAPLEVLGGSQGRPLEVLGVLGVSFGIPGGAWVALMEPLGSL